MSAAGFASCSSETLNCNVKVSLDRPGTNVLPPVVNVPTTARRENSNLVVNLPTLNLVLSVFIQFVSVEVLRSTVLFVSIVEIMPGVQSMSLGRLGLLVS